MGQPTLTVLCTGTKNLGRCYNAYYYTLQTRWVLKDEAALGVLKALNLGQEYTVYGREELDNGPGQDKTYNTKVEVRVDSSD